MTANGKSGRRLALYARVSSDKQAHEGTMDSQLALLRQRIEADGGVVEPESCFLDDGVSGTTLVRPALERLRDQAAAGALDRLYVLAPDRLARRFAHQVLLVDELRGSGVEVVFLNRAVGETPEDQLLLQVQGVVAEYERAKILERTRRGRLHAARCGRVSVLAGAPYGYRYVDKHTGGGTASWQVVEEEARIVRQMFAWVGRDGFSLARVARRLERLGVRTRSGKTRWNPATVWGMLTNAAYRGQAMFGKTRQGPRRLQLRPRRGQAEVPKHPYSTYARPASEQLPIAVPALVDDALFAAVQAQLAANRLQLRQRREGARYLVQGLAVCAACGYGIYGKGSCGGPSYDHAYYRCRGRDGCQFGGQAVCGNPMQPTADLDEAVWQDLCGLLSQPERLRQEYQRRQRPGGAAAAEAEKEAGRLRLAITKVKQGISRLLDAYSDGLVERTEFEPRVRGLKDRLVKLEGEQQAIQEQARQDQESRQVLDHLDNFVEQVKEGLSTADWSKRREIVRTMVKRVEVDKERIRIVYKVSANPFANRPEGGVVQHCWSGLCLGNGPPCQTAKRPLTHRSTPWTTLQKRLA